MEMFTAVVEVVRGARDEQQALVRRMSLGRRLRVGSPDVVSKPPLGRERVPVEGGGAEVRDQVTSVTQVYRMEVVWNVVELGVCRMRSGAYKCSGGSLESEGGLVRHCLRLPHFSKKYFLF